MLSALLVSVQAQAADSGFSIGGGAEYTTGEYGGETSIDEVYAPLNLTYDAARVSVRVTIPYLSVRAPQGTVTEGPDGETLVGEGPLRTESGLGDIVAAVTVYDVASFSRGDFALDMTGAVKFGTADENKGLGTGEEDFSVRADLFRFFDRFTAFGSVGYSVRGDPAAIDLEDVFFASAGGTVLAGSRTRLGVFYDYQESSLPGADALQDMSASFSSSFGDSWRTSGYVLVGFSDSSPDWGVGLALTVGF
jgi:hypothetical protein